ncbi:MAG: hypothetical protein ACRDWD_10775, partial [Acidimicrobiia bacterium]
CGTNPLLDPLFSTDRMTITHGSITHTRLGKIQWLVDEHPELLAFLKVCYVQNRPDNCGQCGKCLYTMACLFTVDSVARATEFPPDLDVERVRRLRLPHMKARIDWAEVAVALDARGSQGELRAAIVDALRASTVAASYRYATADPWVPHRWTRDNRLNLILSLALEGRPHPPLEERETLRPLGLLEVSTGGGPEYRLGTLPHPGRVRELGTLVPRPLPGAVPVWVTTHGELHTRGMRPPLAARARRLFSRRVTARDFDESTTSEPSGYLHQREEVDRIPLFASWHPVLGHQVLFTDRGENRDAVLLGYLEPPSGP